MDTLIEAGADLGEALLMGVRAQNAAVVKQLISVRDPRESHDCLDSTGLLFPGVLLKCADLVPEKIQIKQQSWEPPPLHP